MPKVVVPESKKKIGLKDLLSIPQAGSGVMRDPDLSYEDDKPRRLKKAVDSLRGIINEKAKDRAPSGMTVMDLPDLEDSKDLNEPLKRIEETKKVLLNKNDSEDQTSITLDEPGWFKSLMESEKSGIKKPSVEPKEDKPSSMGDILKEAMVPAITTGIGALFGGYEGGAIGAGAGKEYLQKKQDLSESERQRQMEKIKNDMLLSSKGLKIDPDTLKVSPDSDSPYWTEKAIETQSKLAQIAVAFGKENAQKLAQELQSKRLSLEERRLDLKDRSMGQMKTQGISKEAGNLRKEYTGLKEVKDFKEVATQFEKIKRAAANPSAASDISLIFGYMRMQDPASTVREGEYATAQNAGGVTDSIRNAYNKALSGERLNPKQRTDFVRSAADLYQAQKMGFDQATSKYKDLAEQYNVKPELLFGREKPVSAPKEVTREYQGKLYKLIDPSRPNDKNSWKVVGE